MCIYVKPFFHIIILTIYILAFFAVAVDNTAPFHSCRHCNTWCIIVQTRWGNRDKSLCTTLTHKQMNLIQK